MNISLNKIKATFILLCYVFVLVHFSYASDKNCLLLKDVEVPPLIDGVANDKCWSGVVSHKLKFKKNGNDSNIVLKGCKNKNKIFFLAEFDSESESRCERLWHWDDKMNIYVQGNEREDSLTLYFTEKKDSSYADIWVWRAGRTDVSGHADDLFFFGNASFSAGNENLDGYRADKGENSWYSKYYSTFSGPSVPRFYNRAPSGSAADVKARGRWLDGRWTVEFERNLSTGFNDDMDFSDGKEFFLRIFFLPPESPDDIKSADALRIITK